MTKASGSSVITNITHKGFELIRRNEKQRFLWKDFKSITFDKTKHKVICKKGILQKIVLSDYFEGWYCFIQKIPEQFNDFDRKFVEQFFSHLRSCKICGNVAVYKNTCCNCGNDAWNKILAEEYDSEMEYLREEQLDFFATHDESDVFSGFYQHNICFHFAPSWQPLITKAELSEYCEQHYWE